MENTDPIGFVDRVEGAVVYGWAIDRGSDGPAMVECLVDGEKVGEIAATLFRADLTAEIEHGRVAFEFPLPPCDRGAAIEFRHRRTGHLLTQGQLRAPAINLYSYPAVVSDMIDDGKHREFVGAHWEMMGYLQLGFLVAEGLRADHTILDMGCGCLRAGRRLVEYLQPNKYYGIDKLQGLLDAGYHFELTRGQRKKLPRSHLHATDDFVSPFDARFDFAIAQELFSHLPPSLIARCLQAVARTLNPNGVIYATFFERPADATVDGPITHPGSGVVSFGDRDPYHVKFSEIEQAAAAAKLKAHYIGDWGHPSHQMMVKFTVGE